jgi:hypothetical protein
MLITLDDDIQRICSEFANKVVSTNIDKYAERNQTDIQKIINDIYVGKVAEYAVYKLLVSRGKSVKEPDVEVYSAKKKSFSADLTDGTLQFHVKCMKKEAAERYGLSWSFQMEDPLIRRPNESDVLVLCEYDNDNIDIKAFIKANKVTSIYTKPFLKKLEYIKKVLMWDDVYKLMKGENG